MGTPYRGYTEVSGSSAPDVPYRVNAALRDVDADVESIDNRLNATGDRLNGLAAAAASAQAIAVDASTAKANALDAVAAVATVAGKVTAADDRISDVEADGTSQAGRLALLESAAGFPNPPLSVTDSLMLAVYDDPASQFASRMASRRRVYTGISAASYAAPGSALDRTAELQAMLTAASAIVDNNGQRGHDGSFGKVKYLVEIPAGVWNTTQQLVIPDDVSVHMHPAAVIRATAAIAGGIVTTTSQPWEGQSFVGGTIDCNLLAQDGLVIRVGRYSHINHTVVTDPIRHGVVIGDTTLTATSFEMKPTDVMVRRRDGLAVAAGAYGFYLPSVHDSVFTSCVAVGFDSCFRNHGGDNRFIACHGWGYPGGFPNVVFDERGAANNTYTACVADSPAVAGWHFEYGDGVLVNCIVFLSSLQPDNVVVGVRTVGANGSRFRAFGCRFQGASNTVRLKADFAGTVDETWRDRATILGQQTEYAVSALKNANHFPPNAIGGQTIPIVMNFPGALVLGDIRQKWIAPVDMLLTQARLTRWSGTGGVLRMHKQGIDQNIDFGTGDLINFTPPLSLKQGESIYFRCSSTGTAADVTVSLTARQEG